MEWHELYKGCGWCGAEPEGAPFKLCSRCRQITFCSAECQKADRAAHRAMCGTFMVGAAVVVEGLVKQTAHNGRGGRVVGALDVTTGRYGVELDGDGTRLSLKPGNMRLAKGA